jgi:uncharacterized protein (DUF302 family)
LAFATLQEDINIGLLLPCNVVVYETDPNRSVVAAVDANAMMSVIGENPGVKEVAQEVNERLHRVLEQI